jgi:hypothetical protein
MEQEPKSQTRAGRKQATVPDPNPADLGGAGARETATPAGETRSGAAVTDRAKQAVTNIASRAGEEVTSRIDDQKERAADGLGTLAHAIRQTGQQLGNEGDGARQYVQYMDAVARRVEQAAEYLRTQRVGDMLGQVENFARRQPAVFIGSAFALGIIGARFLKTSSTSAPARASGTRAMPPSTAETGGATERRGPDRAVGGRNRTASGPATGVPAAVHREEL